MSHSSIVQDMVILYDTWSDKAFWLTPSHAKRLQNAWGAYDARYEQINEDDPRRGFMEQMAGPRPMKIIPPTENWDAEDKAADNSDSSVCPEDKPESDPGCCTN